MEKYIQIPNYSFDRNIHFQVGKETILNLINTFTNIFEQMAGGKKHKHDPNNTSDKKS